MSRQSSLTSCELSRGLGGRSRNRTHLPPRCPTGQGDTWTQTSRLLCLVSSAGRVETVPQAGCDVCGGGVASAVCQISIYTEHIRLIMTDLSHKLTGSDCLPPAVPSAPSCPQTRACGGCVSSMLAAIKGHLLINGGCC